MSKKMKTILLLMLSLSMMFAVACGSDSNTDVSTDESASNGSSEVPSSVANAPWNNGGKQPSEYTYEEFEALPKDQQIAFQQSFSDIAAFDEWLQGTQNTVEENPWDKGGKKPSEYTLEEFEKLTPGQQIAFQKSFGSVDAFEAWRQQFLRDEIDLPWEEEGAKQPKDYTKKEFEALTPGQQIAFQKTFASSEEFMQWLKEH